MAFENVHNYLEQLVFEEINRSVIEQQPNLNENLLEDIACVALNNLTPHYVSHNVYLAFYQSPAERKLIDSQVRNAVADAVTFVLSHQRS